MIHTTRLDHFEVNLALFIAHGCCHSHVIFVVRRGEQRVPRGGGTQTAGSSCPANWFAINAIRWTSTVGKAGDLERLAPVKIHLLGHTHGRPVQVFPRTSTARNQIVRRWSDSKFVKITARPFLNFEGDIEGLSVHKLFEDVTAAGQRLFEYLDLAVVYWPREHVIQRPLRPFVLYL